MSIFEGEDRGADGGLCEKEDRENKRVKESVDPTPAEEAADGLQKVVCQMTGVAEGGILTRKRDA